MEILKLLSASEILAQLICFLAVFFLLRAFLWKSFLKILDDRRNRVAEEIQQIDSAKAEVAKLKDDFESKLKTIEDIAVGKYDETIKKGEEVGEEIKDRARQEAQRIVSVAKAEIEQAVTKTKEELKKQVVELTLQATQKLIEERISADDDRKLVSDFVNKMEKL